MENRLRMNHKGFCFTESLLAMLMLGIIALIMYPGFIKVKRNIEYKACYAQCRDAEKEAEQILRENSESISEILTIESVMQKMKTKLKCPCGNVDYTVDYTASGKIRIDCPVHKK